ncbi:glycosyltransferase [Paracoccus aestuariivivens]|uniref:glycosyltransferase n=1 Tax=Paracoccus aestuariivivens TaxID=1820333 RepID=UPI0014780E4F|nr:glycosyltransferase [Paracoccus aestuariivivens]
MDPLWQRDLIAHFDYISDICVIAPRVSAEQPPKDWVPVRAPVGRVIAFHEFGEANSGWSGILAKLPSDIRTAWSMVGQADLVHSGIAGWPIPPGMLFNPIAVLRRKPLILVVESAFWRVQDRSSATFRAKVRAALTEAFAKWSLRQASFAVFTSTAYRESLPVGPSGTAMVLPASWIAATDVLSGAAASLAWNNKPSAPRFLMASRLSAEKGVGLFIEAVKIIDAQGVPLTIDVIGDGPLGAQIVDVAANTRSVRLRLLQPVPYGPQFLKLLGGYHAAIVPTTGDEQPRIIYDALSQAVPIIATDTPGNREVLADGRSGWLVRGGSADALAKALIERAEHCDELPQKGLSGLTVAHEYTHETMHRRRATAMLDLFGAKPKTTTG